MNSTVKMIKIPLELYKRLTNKTDENLLMPPTATYAESQPIQTFKQDISENIGAHADDASAGQNWIKYNQAYKRYKKLFLDQQARPTNVRIQNVADIMKAVKRETPHSSYLSSVAADEEPVANNGKEVDDDDEFRSIADGDESGDSSGLSAGSAAHINVELPTTSTGDANNIRQILEYIDRNNKKLGVNQNSQILWKYRHRIRPIKSSNIYQIVDYHFSKQKYSRAPPGYSVFIKRALNDPVLAQQMSTPKQHGGGFSYYSHNPINRGNNSAFYHFNKYKKQANNFKPRLW